MNCPNCHTQVDNDLIFCTNCGQRLMQSQAETPTVVNPKKAETSSVGNPNTLGQPNTVPEKSKRWIWALLSLFILGISALIFFSVFIYRVGNSGDTVANTKSKPTATVEKTPALNENENNKSNLVNNNANIAASANTANTNSIANANPDSDKQTPKDIFNEQIELGAGEHKTVDFTVDVNGLTKIVGKVETLNGESMNLYVYTKDGYKMYFPDTTYKLFDYDGKLINVEQVLHVKDEYALVFLNKNDKPISVKGKISLEPYDISSQ